jgi:hypothetical protein
MIEPAVRPLRIDAVVVLSFFVVLLFLLPSRYVFGPLGGAGTPAGVVAVLCFFWYCAAMFNARSTPVRGRQPLRGVLAFFVVTILASYAGAMTRKMPAVDVLGADRGIILVIGWVGVALLMADGVVSVDRLEVLRRRLVTCATVVAVLGIIQFFAGIDIGPLIKIPGLVTKAAYVSLQTRDEFNRPSATAIHPIEFGVVMAMVLPMALHGALYAPPERRRLRWLQVGLIGAALPMTVSRSALLGGFIVALHLLPTWPKARRHAAYAVLFVSAVIMRMIIPGLMGTILNLFSGIGTESSSAARTGDYGAVGERFAQHPWLGQGFGTTTPQNFRVLDNQYLATLVETGIIGLIAVLTVLVSGWLLARGARKATRDDETRHLAQCFAASVAAAAISFGTFDAFSFPMAACLTYFMVGGAAALWRLTHQPPDAFTQPIRIPAAATA